MADPKRVSLKKLTAKDICGYGIDDFTFEIPPARTMLFTIYGAADKFSTKGTQHNKTQKLLSGRFEAVRLIDNVIFEGSNLYLPDNDAQEAIAQAIKDQREQGVLDPIELAYIVGFQKGKSPTGYTWIVDALTDTKTQDSLAGVRNLVSDQKLLARFADAMPAAVAKLAAPAKK
jgi:hypothetical protein